MNITELRALSIENAKKLMTQDIGAGQAFSNLFFAIDVFYNQEAAQKKSNSKSLSDADAAMLLMSHSRKGG